MMRSLKLRLLVGMFCTTILVLVLFGFVIHETIKRALVEEFDASLLSVAHTLATSVEYDEADFEFEFDTQQLPEFQHETGIAYFQFWLSDKKVLKRSPSLEESNLVYFCGESLNPAFRYLILPNGRNGRAVGIKFKCRSGDNWINRESVTRDTLILVVSKDTTDLEKKVRFVRWLLFSAGVSILMISLLITAVVVSGGLKPLRSLSGRIAAIREDNLSDRISSSGMSTEFEPIVNKLNDMLDRLEFAFIRERAFAADVAHELRTPLAGIRSTLDVALSRDRDSDEYKEALKDTLAITTRLQSMINSLLLLARFDTGQVKLSYQRIELAPLIDLCWKQYSGKAKSRNIVFKNKLPSHLTLKSSHDIVSMVMSILLDNASKYTNDDGHICATGKGNKKSIEIIISNTGCKLPPENVNHVFDRLWRGDPSRSNTGEHFGLGLSLAHRAVNVLSGTISASVDDTEVFMVSVIFPISLQFFKKRTANDTAEFKRQI